EDLLAAVARRRARPGEKRALLRRLGAEVARLHRAGFVHGDLVPPNVRVVGECFIFLDNDRTRRSRLLVGLVGRRNLVQLGRFVVPGLTLSDRARVLAAYAAGRGFSRRTHRRLARWLVSTTVARRCPVAPIPEEAAAPAGRGGPTSSTLARCRASRTVSSPGGSRACRRWCTATRATATARPIASTSSAEPDT